MENSPLRSLLPSPSQKIVLGLAATSLGAVGLAALVAACGDIILPAECPPDCVSDASVSETTPDAGDEDGATTPDAGDEDADVPDSGGDVLVVDTLAARILSPVAFTTVTAVPWSAPITAQADCPEDNAPCTFTWQQAGAAQPQTGNLAIGRNTLSLGTASLGQAGTYFAGTLTVVNRTGDTTSAKTWVSAWDKSFTDDFQRADLGFETRGWRTPNCPNGCTELPGTSASNFTIDTNALKINGDDHAPASAGLLAMPVFTDGHAEYIQRRTREVHYSDLLVRVQTASLTPLAGPLDNPKYYRIRLHEYAEQRGTSSIPLVQVALFRGGGRFGEFGGRLNQRTWSVGDAGIPDADTDGGGYASVYTPARAETCDEGRYEPQPGVFGPYFCPTAELTSYADVDRFRLMVDVRGTTFTIQVFGLRAGDPVSGGTLLVSDTYTDASTDAIRGPGLWGLAHFEGTTYFERFTMQSTDP